MAGKAAGSAYCARLWSADLRVGLVLVWRWLRGRVGGGVGGVVLVLSCGVVVAVWVAVVREESAGRAGGRGPWVENWCCAVVRCVA